MVPAISGRMATMPAIRVEALREGAGGFNERGVACREIEVHHQDRIQGRVTKSAAARDGLMPGAAGCAQVMHVKRERMARATVAQGGGTGIR